MGVSAKRNRRGLDSETCRHAISGQWAGSGLAITNDTGPANTRPSYSVLDYSDYLAFFLPKTKRSFHLAVESRSALTIWRRWTGRLWPIRLHVMDNANAAGRPFFVWLNPTRVHVVTHLSPKCEAMRNSRNGWTIQEAGVAELDDEVGAVMQHHKEKGLDQTLSCCSLPTKVPNNSPGPMAARRRSRCPRKRSWRAASGCSGF